MLCWSLYFYVQGRYHAKGAALKHLHDLSWGRGERGRPYYCYTSHDNPMNLLCLYSLLPDRPPVAFQGRGMFRLFFSKYQTLRFESRTYKREKNELLNNTWRACLQIFQFLTPFKNMAYTKRYVRTGMDKLHRITAEVTHIAFGDIIKMF